MRRIEVVEGDTLTMTIKGIVQDPSKAGSDEETMLKIYRSASGLYSGYHERVGRVVDVSVVFKGAPEITYDVKSPFKNGIHIDDNGRYWMRRPDGWHEIKIEDKPVPSIPGTRFTPPGVQRLKEDKDS